jgi:hypothetical protein
MKRIVAVVAALGLAVSACGSGDDAGSDATAEATADSAEASSGDASSDEGSTAEETEPEETEESAADVTTTTEQIEESEGTAGQDDTSASTDDDNGDDTVSGGPIRSIGDIPEVCREQMLNFLRDVEPIVSTIDWQTATFGEFEAIIGDFEAISTEFEQQNLDAGCDDLEFADDREFELMIEFAENEAPGTVGFLRFLAQVNQTTGGGDTGDGSASGAGFADCQEAIDFVQGLIDDYDSFTEVPAASFGKFSGLAAIFITCSPEQLEFFDSPAVNDFLS